MKYWLGYYQGDIVGIAGDIDAALADHPFNEDLASHELPFRDRFDEVSKAQYEDTVLGLRFEDGEWQL
jgi:hypothetical protein